jgi:hypothetical protein
MFVAGIHFPLSEIADDISVKSDGVKDIRVHEVG